MPLTVESETSVGPEPFIVRWELALAIGLNHAARWPYQAPGMASIRPSSGVSIRSRAAGANRRSGCRAKARSPLPEKEHCWKEPGAAPSRRTEPDRNEIGCRRLKRRASSATIDVGDDVD